MSRATKWIFPVVVAVVFIGLMAADVIRVFTNPKTPAVAPSTTVESYTFHAREPVLDLRGASRDAVQGRLGSFSGFSFGEGWSRFTKDGIWGEGSRSLLSVALLADDLDSLVLDCRPVAGLGAEESQSVEVLVNDVACEPFRLAPKHRVYRVALPPGALQIGSNTIEFRYAHHISPHEASGAKDTRQLAVHFRRLALVRGPDISGRKFPRSKTIEVGAESGFLKLREPGRLVVPFSADRQAYALRFGYTVHGVEGARDAHLRARAAALEDGRVVFRDEVTIDLETERSGRVSLELGGDEGEVALVVDLEGEGRRFALTVRSPQAIISPTRDGEAPSDDDDRAASAIHDRDRPDVLMIILDAARVDHMGLSHGYHRDTAPVFDNLATTSLLFSNVRAQASYTACSVPTMITGVSFASHGVAKQSDRLSPHEVTLAERLAAEGYETIAFSATPNNSRRLGTHQGFDEFHELWKGRPWLEAVDPFLMASKAEERLAGLEGDRPYFLMLHFLAPHSPYTPRDPYRLWNDPRYRGECDGSEEYLERIYKKQVIADADDIREMVALYDGNLRMADAAVDRVIRAAVRHGRPDNTLLLITSDHGEAFFEHGKQGHNSTIYDEMLRVPLLVRLPGGERPDAVDLEQEATLEDLVPTVLGVTGLQGDERITGVDLLSTTADRDRMLFRTTSVPGVTGLILGRHKVMRNRHGRIAELYDLQEDPDEQRNLATVDPLLMIMLSHALESELAAAAPPFEGEDPLAVSDEDRAVLEALGYARD